ncbi:MAG: peptide chain release factor N(5)-glutamine methyltransferase [Planctomycetes bacterium]|nr:peptide chain release factor N(5)-glutamine methyltransferase [Planctomycetota bacterium]
MTSIRQFIEDWRVRLQRADVDDSRLNVELLLAHGLGATRGDVRARLDESLDAEVLERLTVLCERRLKREPVDYIIGHREFYGREFHVEPGVLVPRPETELIIDLAKELLPQNASGWAVDVGCGSGVLAVTLALEFPRLRTIAADLYPTPLKVTGANAERLNARVFRARMDGLSALGGKFELIVSNPPYVKPEEYPDLEREVRDHEPEEALVGGVDGLDVAKRILADVAARLNPGGHLLMEHGMTQGEALREAATRAGLANARTVKDYAGLDRILVTHA